MHCPACAAEIIQGIRECPECQTNLSYLEEPANKGEIQRKILEDTIGSIKDIPSLVIPQNSSLRQCIQFLQNKKQKGSIAVVDDEGKIVGIITENDLLFKVAGKDLNLDEEKVENYMTPQPECLASTDTIAYALHRMGHGGYRHIPLVDEEGHPTGLISAKDIMQYIVTLVYADHSNI